MKPNQAVERINTYLTKIANDIAKGAAPLHEKQAAVNRLSVFSRAMAKHANIVLAIKEAYPEHSESARTLMAFSLAKAATKYANMMQGYGPGAGPANPAAPQAAGTDGGTNLPGGMGALATPGTGGAGMGNVGTAPSYSTSVNMGGAQGVAPGA